MVCIVLSVIIATGSQSFALDPIAVSVDNNAVDITDAIDFFFPLQNDSLKVSTAPDANGIVRRVGGSFAQWSRKH